MAWNGSQAITSEKIRERPQTRFRSHGCRIYGILVSLLVLTLCVAAVWLIVGHSSENCKTVQEQVPQRVISSAKPSLVTNNSTNDSYQGLANVATTTVHQAASNAARSAWIRQKQKELAKVRESGSNRPKAPYEIFKHPVENRIAGLLRSTPGAAVIVPPRYSKRFVEDFKKSCKEPIVIVDADSDYDKQLKRDMIECKIDLCNRMAAGEDLADILSSTHRELAKLGQIKKDIERIVRQEIQEKAETEGDVDTIIEAANNLLESKGIAPLKSNPLIKRNLKRFVDSKDVETVN